MPLEANALHHCKIEEKSESSPLVKNKNKDLLILIILKHSKPSRSNQA